MTVEMVQNLTWDSNASQKGLDKTAKTISTAIDKGVTRITQDVQRSTDKLAATIKGGAAKVAEATKRTATTNESGNNQTAPVAAVQAGLRSVAVSATRIADHVNRHPADLGAVTETGRAVGEQFADLIDRASKYAEVASELRETTAETAKTADWIAGKFDGREQDVSIGNGAFGRLSDFS